MTRTLCPCWIPNGDGGGIALPSCSVCAGDGFLDEVGPPRCPTCVDMGDSCETCDGRGDGSQWLPPMHRHAFVFVAVLGGVVYDRDDQPRLLDDVRDADAIDAEWAMAAYRFNLRGV